MTKPAPTRNPDPDRASETALENSLQGARASAPADSQPVENAPKPSDGLPSAGPHADPSLINPDATPGAGSLPSPDEDDVGSTSS